VPVGVSKIAKQYNKPVIAFAGHVGNIEAFNNEGITSVFSIMQGVSTLEKAFENAKNNLEKTVENVVKSISIDWN
jgi:glycerate 2-kinase